MKLVRIVSDTPSDAADLISFLESHGFTVQNSQVVDSKEPLPDFEIDLRVLPVNVALDLAREMASGDIDVFFGTGVFPETQPQIVSASIDTIGEPAEEEQTPAAPAQPGTPAADPFPLVPGARLRESVIQVVKEARVTGRECLALCSAGLLNGFEQTRQRLEQARILLIRKRTVIEARAVRARSTMENRLRFDSTSQNAWIRSAFAGAGLMVVLITLMLWKDQRLASDGSPVSRTSSTPIMTTPPTVAATTSEAATSAPVATALHHKSSERIEIVDDREVVIRHFGRPSPKKAVAIDTQSGIKHISDMN
jgi:hypothetical protein